jgi:TolB protein
VVENLRPKLDGGGGGVLTYCYQPLVPEMGKHQVYGINANGIGNRKLIYSDIGLNHMDVAPDGKKVTCVGYIGTNPETWSIHVFNLDGTGLSRLTTTSGIQDTEPAWSPDGTKIAFTRINFNAGTEELWVMNADGTNLHSIGINGFAARWSNDGTRFIYSKKSGNYDIYTCSVDGNNETRLTNTPADETFPSWSHNGEQILYSLSEGGEITYEICIMNSDGSNPKNLTTNTSFDSNPRWSPSDSLIAFHSDRHQPGQWEIYLMNADGSEPKRVTYSQEYFTAINPVWVTSGSNPGISETETGLGNIHVFPNPVHEIVHITIQNRRSEDTDLIITNMKGQVCCSKHLSSIRDYTDSINISGFESGTYILSVNHSAVKLLIY